MIRELATGDHRRAPGELWTNTRNGDATSILWHHQVIGTVTPLTVEELRSGLDYINGDKPDPVAIDGLVRKLGAIFAEGA